MIREINSNSIINLPNPAFIRDYKNQSSLRNEDRITQNLKNSGGDALIVNVSAEARKLSMQLTEYNEQSPLKPDMSLFTEEVIKEMRAEFARKIVEPMEIDPFDNEFQILGVRYIFNEGTLEKFITDSLEGKMKNASLVAGELGEMIRGAAYKSDATLEERATKREIALKVAEYIANNYFNTADEAKAFLNVINRFAENDILREKGYNVIDNANIAPFRSYMLPIDGYDISWDEYAKKYGYENMLEIISVGKSEAFRKALDSNKYKWDEEIIKAFDDNEKKVSAVIDATKNSISEDAVLASLQRFMKVF